MASTKLYFPFFRLRILPLFKNLDSCSLRNNMLCNIKSISTHNRPTKAKSERSLVKLGLIGVSLGTIAGTGYSFYKVQQTQTAVLNLSTDNEMPMLLALPNVPTTREVHVPTDNTGLKITLFQYPTCPFCCKVRAFLDYYGFSYNVVEVNPVLRQQISWSKYKKVPIVLAETEGGYQQLVDSSMIVSALTSYLHDKHQALKDVVKFYPNIGYNDEDGNLKTEILNRYFLMYQGTIPSGETKESLAEERKWRKWVDDVFVHVLSPNVYRTPTEALQAFNWFSKVGEWETNFPLWETYLMIYIGAFAMWIIAKRLKSRHHLKDDVRRSLYNESNHWMAAIKKKGTMFMGGANPNLADLAMYGVLSSIEGCDAFTDLLANTSIGSWYDLIKTSIQSHAGHNLIHS